MSDILHQYKMAGYQVVLYSNRLEILQGSLFGKKTETILLRNITNVESGVGKRLTVYTNDGKKNVINVAGKDAEQFHKLIVERL